MSGKKIISLFLNERLIFQIFCTGLVYSMFFWPLANAILSISLAAYWLLFGRKIAGPDRWRRPLALLFAAVFGVFAVGLLYSANLGAGITRIQHQLPILLFPIVFGFSRIPDPAFSRLITGHYIVALVLAAATGLVSGLIRFHGAVTGMTADAGNLVFPATYPYILAMQCLLGLLFLAENVLPAWLRPRKTRFVLVAFLALYLFLLNVRLVSGLALGFLVYYGWRRIAGTRLRVALVAGLVAAGFVFLRAPSISGKWHELAGFHGEGMIPLDTDASLGRDWGGTAIRLAIWRSSRELLARHPLTGVGTGDAQDSLQQAYRDHKFYFASEYNRYNIHNQYLNMLLVAGAGGLLVLLAAGVVPLVVVKKDLFAWVRPLFLLAFFGVCLTEVILDTSRGAAWYAFFNALLVFGGFDRGRETCTVKGEP